MIVVRSGTPSHEGADPVRRDMRPGRVIGVADDQQLGRGRDLLEHRVEVVDVALAKRDPDLPRSAERRQVGVDRERGPGEEDLVALLAERERGGEQDLAGAVGDGDPGRIGLVVVRDRAAERTRVRDPGSG